MRVSYGNLMLQRVLLMTAMVFAFSVAQESSAARPARVTAEEAPLLKEPNEGAEVIEALRKGRALAASNYPVDGYHKVRTSTGSVGWVDPVHLVLFDIPENSERDPQLDPAQKGTASESSGPARSFSLRGLGGAGIFSLAAVNEQFGLSGVRYGLHGGVEISYAFSRWFGLTFRSEAMGKVFVMTDDGSNKSYQVSVYSYPILAGADLRLVDLKHFKLTLGGYGGAGLWTQLISDALSETTPNQTALQGTALTAMGKLGVDVPIWSWLGLSFEAGYRYLASEALTPIVSGNGNEIFNDSDGERVPLVVNLSGPFVSAGVVFLF